VLSLYFLLCFPVLCPILLLIRYIFSFKSVHSNELKYIPSYIAFAVNLVYFYLANKASGWGGWTYFVPLHISNGVGLVLFMIAYIIDIKHWMNS
jgi:hypothetical protein